MDGGRPAPRIPAGPPPGFVEVRSPAGSWVARQACAGAIESGQADFLFLGAPGRATAPGAGRGGVTLFELGGCPAVGKRALHGGLLGGLLGDVYVGRRRGLSQIAVADRLERAGVPTPPILAVGSRRRLGFLHAQAIVTRAIPGALNLYEAARQDAPGGRRRKILEQSADLLRAMHDAGFLHADLNMANLVLERGPDGGRAYVVDLDRGRFLDPFGTAERFRNLARLLRSYEKWLGRGHRLAPREELVFLRRYCRSDRSLLRLLLGRLRRYRAALRLRRLIWRVSGLDQA